MRLEPLYTLRYHYPEAWDVSLVGSNGKEGHNFLFAEGACTGRIAGTFRAANHPRQRTDGTYGMDMQGLIATEDGATILADYRGYGRSRARSDELYAEAGLAGPTTALRRQVVGFARHVADAPKYAWLNDAVAAIAGEVRVPPGIPADQLKQGDVQLVFQVDELRWEAPPE